MKKLSTIQKREKLNEVYAIDDVGPGGAHHEYVVRSVEKYTTRDTEHILTRPTVETTIQFQKGARKAANATHGIIDADLLEMVRHRLQSFQEGPFASKENEEALRHIEEALMWMNRRVEDRIERDVLGTYNK